MRLPALFVLLAAATAAADPPKPPAKVTSAVGQIWRVEVDCDAGKDAVWYPGFADEDCFVDELKPLRPNTLRLIVQPKRAGVFRVGLLTVGERQFSTLVIDATGDGPTPPAPNPDDDKPKPPKPPEPKPADVLAKAVAAAYAKDSATRPQLAKYAALFRAAAAVTANDPDLKTGADLLAELQRAVKNLGIPPGSLANTARAVAAHLDKTLADLKALDAAARAAAATAFTEVAAALEAAANG